MEYLVTSPHDVDTASVIPLLEEISARCRAQKEYEENDEYLPSLIAEHPDLAETIRQLPKEHTKLQSDVTELLATLQQQPGTDSLHKTSFWKTQQWLAWIAEHQRRVQSVIEQAFPAEG